MSAEKKVFSRLFKEDKTELATQKIQLAIPNLIDISEEIESNWKKTSKTISVEGKRMLDKVLPDLKALNKSVLKLKKEKNDFVGKAEALGFDRKTIDGELRKITSVLKSGERQSEDLTNKVKLIRSSIF